MWIFVLAFVGFGISKHIYTKKKKNEPLVCVIGKNCDVVVRSKYRALTGVPNEVLGMLFFIASAVGALLLLFGVTTVFGISVLLAMTFAGGLAVLFSVLLIFLQAFVLRQWCDHCIASAGVNIAIFLFELEKALH